MALTRAQWRQAVLDAAADVATKEAAWQSAQAAATVATETATAAREAVQVARVALAALRQARRSLFDDDDA